MKPQFIILSTVLACSCASNATSSEQPKAQTIKLDYQISDRELNNAFRELNTKSPVSLQLNLKQEQTQWLNKRGEICNYHSLEHPKNLQTLTCFISLNSIRAKQLIE